MPHDSAALALLGLTLCVAACPVDGVNDSTSTFLITEPVERMEIVVDRGTLVATAYDRSVVEVKRHTFGFMSSLGEPDYTVEDGVVRFEAHCSGRRQECTWDHLLELTLGVDLDVTMTDGSIEVGDLDGDIAAQLETGSFEGFTLRSRHVSFTADAATVDLTFAEAPESVKIELGDGDVTLTVPAGAYRCALTGDPEVSGITCDDAATARLDIDVGAGSLTVTGESA